MTGRLFGVALALALVAVGVGRARPVAGEQAFSEWSVPMNLGPAINSAFDDNGPALSKDGLSLYFASNRSGGEGELDIWVSRRESRDDPWQLPLNLGPVVNTDGVDHDPALSRDGHWLFMSSGRAGGFGAFDIWAAWRVRAGVLRE